MAKLLFTGSVWAIRHRPTETYMPQLSNGKRYTYVEVDQFSPSKPRIFLSHRRAAAALTAWLAGEWKGTKIYQDHNGELDVFGPAPPDSPPPDRKREDMELVEFNLTEIATDEHLRHS